MKELSTPEPYGSPMTNWYNNNLSFSALDRCEICGLPAVDGTFCEVHSKEFQDARIDWEDLKREVEESELFVDPDVLKDELDEYGPDYKEAQYQMEDKADNDAKDARWT